MIRPYGVMDKVEIIPGGAEVPEPTGLLLAAGGLGLLVVRQARRIAA